MLPDTRILYIILLLIITSAADQNETCLSTYNCGLGLPCYYGLDCICPAGYIQDNVCEPSDKNCYKYVVEDLVCYPENSCMGPNQMWKKSYYIYFVCVHTNSPARRTGDVQEYRFHRVDDLAYLMLVYFLMVLLIYKCLTVKEKRKEVHLRDRSTSA